MSDDIKVTDAEAREWANALSAEDKAELKRQALLKRAIDLAQPEPVPDFGAMTDQELEAWKRKHMR